MANPPDLSFVPDDEGKDKFKKSHQVAFYKRRMQGPNCRHRALLDSLVLTEKGARFELEELATQSKLLLLLSPCKSGMIRLLIDELHPVKARYRVKDVLVDETQCEKLRLEEQTEEYVALLWSTCQHRLRVWRFPFQVEILCGDKVLVTLNSQGKLWFETLQMQKYKDNLLFSGKTNLESLPLCVFSEPRVTAVRSEVGATFAAYFSIEITQRCSSLFCVCAGPNSVGLDFCLHDIHHVFGLPEHADHLRLRDTRGGEPYRLYNLDVFAYDLHSRLGLYGSVPLLVAHSPDRSLGIFWLNASETFVNISHNPNDLQDEQTPPLKRRRVQPHTNVHWLSESGVIDCMVLLGPSPQQLFTQYAQLTGFQTLPPVFALGYHQSRWNYNDDTDVRQVDAGFDSHHIPYDVLWLDIEHTDGKRYFTWDPVCFPDPSGLQRHLEKKKRKLVVISDPHIKVDPDWSIYCEARDGGHFIRSRDGHVFEGTCWPGPSSYLDFSSPHTRAWYSRLFSLDKYEGSTATLHVWNDMNEPSVFSGPEQTMPKDAVHDGGWEHRELHNLYGFYQHMATVDGLMTRSGGFERPFVLSRSFFAGSQRLGAVWTGDNVATWEYLKISLPMLLSLSVAGIMFCGADVGGFVQDPDPELLVRWYQAGSLQPFFRGHSERQTKRREPWLFGEEVTAAIRTAIQHRYCLLPYWYTVFHQSHTSGMPVLRPLWVEFPEDTTTFDLDNQYMIGGALLVCPVTDPGAGDVSVLLPGPDQVWYDVQSAVAHSGGRTLNLPVTLETVPVFQRGGTVVCRSEGSGSCSWEYQQLPLSVTVASDTQGSADGELYLDDGWSFRYRDEKAFCRRRFTLHSGRLLCGSPVGEEGTFDCSRVIQSVTILGVKDKPSSVSVTGVKKPPPFKYEGTCCRLTITNLGLSVAEDWKIKYH
ncbi:neutral alpha-glucosidase C isoform X3 [Synchiropus splendidus]|uniref:neutral alpha-glucosidase C isoform X3 n=1 Tax=Synchiropus splendidus TaxID=270530 RepID=UPI00237DFE39|nr:neutral alpha-glucosidase C isoform X3 [Synchiropus splendidus]